MLSHPRVKENVGSWSGCGKHGTGNVLRENCIWPPTFQKAGEGFTLLNNLYVEPAYVNAAAKDFRIVAGTPCAPLVIDPGVGHTGGGSSKGGEARRWRSRAAAARCASAGVSCCPGGSRARAPGSGCGSRCGARGRWATRAQRARCERGGRFRVGPAPAAAPAGRCAAAAGRGAPARATRARCGCARPPPGAGLLRGRAACAIRR